MDKKLIIIIFFLSFNCIASNKINLNECSLKELGKLPLSNEKILSLYEFLGHSDLENIYDLLYASNITIEDIHTMKPYVNIFESDPNTKDITEYKIASLLSENSGLNDILIDFYFTKRNINNITYRELSMFPNVSPIDVLSILKQRNNGLIKGDFDLKNSPGLSSYGFYNLIDYITFDEPTNSNRVNIKLQTGATNWPSKTFSEEDNSLIYEGEDNPETLYKMELKYKKIKVGHLRYNNTGDPYGVYTNKNFIQFNNKSNLDNFKRLQPLSEKYQSARLGFLPQFRELSLDKVIIGNFHASFGKGLVFESGDFNRARNTGYKYRKRLNGIYPDMTNSEELTLNGIAFESSWSYFSLSAFISKDKRDAIINDGCIRYNQDECENIYQNNCNWIETDSDTGYCYEKQDINNDIDRSFTSLIFMRPRLGLGYNDISNKIIENMTNSITEVTSGLDLNILINETTNFGFTYYKSLYDRVLDPQIEYTIVGGGGDIDPPFDANDYDEYYTVKVHFRNTSGDGGFSSDTVEMATE